MYNVSKRGDKMNERIKLLRKTLKLSGEKFGEKLGVKRSAISDLETGRNNLSEQMLLAICREYNVNEEWLRTGNGEMFIKTKESFLNNISKQYSLDDLDIKIIESYLNLSPDGREFIKNYIKSICD